MTALHHDELMNLGVNPNIEIEYENKEKNPYYHTARNELANAIKDFNIRAIRQAIMVMNMTIILMNPTSEEWAVLVF